MSYQLRGLHGPRQSSQQIFHSIEMKKKKPRNTSNLPEGFMRPDWELEDHESVFFWNSRMNE